MKEILTRVFNHEELSRETSKEILLNLTNNKYNEYQITAFISAFQMRGVKVDELLGFRDALLSTCVPIDLSEYSPLDIVGTGGDGKNTFNISTCACFVVAGAGYNVAKHGNYGSTSVSGASDVMAYFGVKFSNNQDLLLRSIDSCAMAYLHAPMFNPAMKLVATIRKSLQVRTVFNLLGPLINPCKPKFQLLGVADLSQMRLYNNIFQRLGVGYAVVNNLDGYDEISLTNQFKVMTNNYESIYSPADMGFHLIKQEELYGGNSIEDAAKIFLSVLQNKSTVSQKNCVLINASFAIQAVNPQKTIEECISMAKESLETGKAYEVFKKFVDINS